jgi:hypothetical protein
MFRALLAHREEALHKRHLVYCVSVMSVGSYHGWSGTGLLLRLCTNGNWYIACVLCLLAATMVEVELDYCWGTVQTAIGILRVCYVYWLLPWLEWNWIIVALYKRQLVYCVCVMSVGCYHGWSGTGLLLRHCTNGNWYIACVLCLLAATSVGVEPDYCWGTVQTAIGILRACYVCWLLPALEWNWIIVEALHKRQLVYCMRVTSVGCYQRWIGTGLLLLLLYCQVNVI